MLQKTLCWGLVFHCPSKEVVQIVLNLELDFEVIKINPTRKRRNDIDFSFANKDAVLSHFGKTIEKN